jgi:drug/metabolite transporter (DMT)-like permease
MIFLALVLLLIAAASHATWNLLVKRAQEKQVMTWLGLLVGVLIYLPVVFLNPINMLSVWPLLLSSAFVEAVYYIALLRAYEHGDFSLVYPMARGTAPALLAVWAALFLGERPTLLGVIGISLLVLGLIVVGGKVWWSLRKVAKLSTNALCIALGVALCISIYSTIDGAAVHRVNPLPYTVMVIALAAAMITPAILLRYGRSAIGKEWRANWLPILLVGIFSLLSYSLALKSYTIIRVSYGGAIREVSVVLAAFLGWRLLNEELGAIRLVGSGLIFSGIVVIALAAS